jgi:hypothetical protein
LMRPIKGGASMQSKAEVLPWEKRVRPPLEAPGWTPLDVRGTGWGPGLIKVDQEDATT